MPDFYSAPGLNVDIYDVRANDAAPPEDLAFYLAYARESGGPVLELGAGTGRVTLALAEAGVEAVGLELSAAMLARAEAKRAAAAPEVGGRVRFVRGDMTDFDLGRAFPLVIVPYRAFQALLTPEAQRAALACVRRHLTPGGRFVFQLFDPRLDLLKPGKVPPHMPPFAVRHPASGHRVTVEVLERVNDPLPQVLREVWRFTETDDACGVVRQEEETLTLRWTYRYEMRHLLELAGLEPEAEFSDFHRSPPAYGKEQIWVARA